MPVQIVTSPRFRKLISKLSANDRIDVERAIDELADGFGPSHRHQGLGVRKLADSLFEFRAGLTLRVLFWFDRGEIVLHFVGNHDDVPTFLKKNK